MNSFSENGWFKIEGISDEFLINRMGKILNAKTGRVHSVHFNTEGYYQAKLIDEYGFPVLRPIHRLVAITFLKKPEKLSEIPFEKLTVIHLDRNRRNNEALNLMWVTSKEMVRHIRFEKTFSNERGVLAKNCQSGEVLSFRSISEAAKWVGVHPNAMRRHLHSESAGRVVQRGHVFLLDKEDLEWPSWVFPEKEHLKIGRVADVVVTDTSNGSNYVFNSIAEAARLLNLELSDLSKHLVRGHQNAPFNGYVFHDLCTFIKGRLV